MLEAVASFANGDARTALSTLEMVVLNGDQKGETTLVTRELLEQCTSRRSLLYDKNGEEHYNLISALHKSMRNSRPGRRRLLALPGCWRPGEDPLYVARRLIRFASEDVGMADSRALEVAVAAYQASHFLGNARVQRPPDPRGGVPVPWRPSPTACTWPTRPPSWTPRRCWRSRCRCKSQRPHPADEGPALRGGLPVRPRHPRRSSPTWSACPTPCGGRCTTSPRDQGSEARAKERLERIKAWKEERRGN